MTSYPEDAWDLLSPRFSEARKQKMLAVAAKRTNHIQLVTQDVHQPHNVSACIRSADAFGILNCHVVTLNDTKFRPSTVARGVSGWLNIDKHETVMGCVDALRARGIKLAAGLPTQNAMKLEDIPIDQPIAVIFGNEHAGIDNSWIEHIDYPFSIPMVGMVESLNISVSAAITLQHLRSKAEHELDPAKLYLTSSAQLALLNKWACQHCANWKLELEKLRR